MFGRVTGSPNCGSASPMREAVEKVSAGARGAQMIIALRWRPTADFKIVKTALIDAAQGSILLMLEGG
jgi:hypothetical protein